MSTARLGVIVCGPDNRFLRRRLLRCQTCKRRRKFVVRFELYHGSTLMCCGCGDSWEDGERRRHPGRSGWRQESKRYHRGLWERARTGRAPTLDEYDPQAWMLTDGVAS